jgi:hypothetical protein
LQNQGYFNSNAAQNPGGKGPLDYYFTFKLALKRIILGPTAAQAAHEAEDAADPLAQKAEQPHADPLPDPESPDGLDWSDEAAYRKRVGPLGDPNYHEMQQAGTSLSGELSQPSGPESTVKINVLKDAMPSNTHTSGQKQQAVLETEEDLEEEEEEDKVL